MDRDAALLRAVTGPVLPLAARLMRAVTDSGATSQQAWAAWSIVANQMNCDGRAIACSDTDLRAASENIVVDALYRP